MMIVTLVLILICVSLWYTVFVVFCDGPRRRRKVMRRANMTRPTPATDGGHPAEPETLGWTALDDQQLTRLLKGSAP